MQVRVLCFYESVGVTCDSYLEEKWIGVEIPVLLCVLHQSSRYFAFGLVSILDLKKCCFIYLLILRAIKHGTWIIRVFIFNYFDYTWTNIMYRVQCITV